MRHRRHRYRLRLQHHQRHFMIVIHFLMVIYSSAVCSEAPPIRQQVPSFMLVGIVIVATLPLDAAAMISYDVALSTDVATAPMVQNCPKKYRSHERGSDPKGTVFASVCVETSGAHPPPHRATRSPGWRRRRIDGVGHHGGGLIIRNTLARRQQRLRLLARGHDRHRSLILL